MIMLKFSFHLPFHNLRSNYVILVYLQLDTIALIVFYMISILQHVKLLPGVLYDSIIAIDPLLFIVRVAYELYSICSIAKYKLQRLKDHIEILLFLPLYAASSDCISLDYLKVSHQNLRY